LTLLQAQVYRVLTIMRRLTFDSALPWTSNSLFGWMISTIRGIRLRGDIDASFCCTPTDTIDIQTKNLAAINPGPGRDFRWLGTLMILFVHEARHTRLAQTMSLSEAREAQELSERGKIHGKVILKIA
jgi:hypothetical protein